MSEETATATEESATEQAQDSPETPEGEVQENHSTETSQEAVHGQEECKETKDEESLEEKSKETPQEQETEKQEPKYQPKKPYSRKARYQNGVKEVRIVAINNDSPGFFTIKNIIKAYNRNQVHHEIIGKNADNLSQTDLEELLQDVDGVVISDGHNQVNSKDANANAQKRLIDIARAYGIPVLGVGYGFHLISEFYGGAKGKVQHNIGKWFKGAYEIEILQKDNTLFKGLETLVGNQDHIGGVFYTSDKIGELNVIARSKFDETRSIVEAVKTDDSLVYGTQFRPEIMDGDANGYKVLHNFLERVDNMTKTDNYQVPNYSFKVGR